MIEVPITCQIRRAGSPSLQRIDGIVRSGLLFSHDGRCFTPVDLMGVYLRVVVPVTPEVEKMLNDSGFLWSAVARSF
jgi:hypothetical protein